ncbi:hypothetical protein ACH5RR_005440 [Cinchona calisaya]|uniref:RING-type E3 ubiquitin transferase n=1 Tax=Cinchona calisaya TaxID=153742 RepID=A0ABD3ALF4_9GENT
MGHRHIFSSSQIFENENDQGWNHGDQPYMHLDNMTVDGGHFTAQWNSIPRSTPGYSSSGLNVGMPQYQPPVQGPSHDPFLHPSPVGSLNAVQENYVHHASSSNHGGQPIHGVDGGFELSVGNGRGPYKRKSPGIPVVFERGNTSRYYDAGSSSDQSVAADTWVEKQNTVSYQSPWDFAPSYRGNGLSIGSEGSLRNVRSRPAFDLESNLARTHLSSNPSHHSFTSQTPDHPSGVDLLGQSSNAPPREWNHTFRSTASNGRNIVSDTNLFSQEANQVSALNGNPGSSLEIGGYTNDFSSNRNPISQALHATSSQYSRGVRSSSYSHRPMPTFRASSSNLHVGSTGASDEGLQLVAESYTSRNPRPFSTIGIRSGDRNGRSRIPSDRYRIISDHAGFRDRPAPEGLVIMDRAAIYGSRNLFDHHRDMRLDIDNLSYEELLALGERIGTVNTGLSDDLIFKCLTESIYCSSDQLQVEGTCVICLEEYRNMDDVGTLRSCGHDFHVGCIRKWLSIKNSCPICKASALNDNMKQQ